MTTEGEQQGTGGGGGGGGGGRGGRGGLQWQPNIGGCESGFTIPDPTNADVVYASCYGNKVTRWDARTGTARSIEPWMITLDSPPNETKYRCHWTAPMAIDPFDTRNILYGCQLILKTSNGGQSWTELSGDLSTKERWPRSCRTAAYMNLTWLSGGVGMGASDEAGSLDYRPTDTQIAVLKVIEQDLARAKAGFESLLSSAIPAFNKQMAGKAVITP